MKNIDQDMTRRGIKPLPSGNEFTWGCGEKHDLRVIKEDIKKINLKQFGAVFSMSFGSVWELE